MTSLGPGVHKAQIERALLDTLFSSFPEYLNQTELERGLASNALPAPRSWAIVNDLDFWPEENLPAGLVFSPGLARPPERVGGGIYNSWWAVAVAVKVYGRDYEEASKFASLYGLTARRICVQRPSLGGIADSVVWVDESFDDLGGGVRHRNLAAAVVSLEVHTPMVVDSSAGPAEPAAVPVSPWSGDSTVTSSDITTENELP